MSDPEQCPILNFKKLGTAICVPLESSSLRLVAPVDSLFGWTDFFERYDRCSHRRNKSHASIRKQAGAQHPCVPKHSETLRHACYTAPEEPHLSASGHAL